MKVKRGILIVDHGSKSCDAVEEFNAVVTSMHDKVENALVLGAHMEINRPDIPTAIDLLMEKGITEIVVVPYFLFMGKHIKKDIPAILKAKKLKHPDLKILYQHPFGVHPLVSEILLEKASGTSLMEI